VRQFSAIQSWKNLCKYLHECPIEPFLKGEVDRWTSETPEAIAVHDWVLKNDDAVRHRLQIIAADPKQKGVAVARMLMKLGFEISIGSTKFQNGETRWSFRNRYHNNGQKRKKEKA